MICGRWRRFKGYRRTLELVNVQREKQAEAEAEAEVDEKAEIDSIDSLICACGSSILMRFSHAHDVLFFEREKLEKASCVKTIETRELRTMQNGVHPERRKRPELAMAEGLTNLTKNLKQNTER
jgi:predicted RNase H-like nuclease